MSGVYGDMLGCFPELFRNVPFYRAKAAVGDGWEGFEKVAEYRVVVLDDRTDKLVRKKIADWVVADMENNDIMYAYDHLPIEIGMFMEHPNERGLHRLVGIIDHSFVGGFTTWAIQRLQGTNPHDTLDLATKEVVF